MSTDDRHASIRRAAWRAITVVVLAGCSLRPSLAQQPPADVGGSIHAAAPREGKAGHDDDIPIFLPPRRPTKQGTNIQASPFLKMTPAKDRAVPPAGPQAVDRNAVGVAIVPRDPAPAVPLVGRVASRAAPQQPLGASALALTGGQMAPLRVPGAQPPVWSRSTIGGASFTRPGMALLPLGGPAKPAATGINGTSIRPKH